MALSLGDALLYLKADSKGLDSELASSEKKTRSWVSSLGGTITTLLGGALVAGVTVATTAVVGIGTAAISTSSQVKQAQNDMIASLGVTEDRAKQLGAVAVDVWKNNWGGSIEEVGAAVSEVERQLGSLVGVNDSVVNQITAGAFAIRDTFGADINQTVGASRVLMEKFGLSSTEALDFITSGFQRGLNSSGDFLESITEYGTQFSSGGATAEQFFSIMQTGLQQGMLGTDKAADAFKEFRVRIQDGSTLTTEALDALGFNTIGFMQQMSDGSVSATDAFGMVMERLNNLNDENLKMQLGVALLGTQFEDLGTEGALALDLNAVKMNELAGATDKLNAKYNNFGAMWETVKRRALAGLIPIGDKLLELGNKFMPLVVSSFDWFEKVLPVVLAKAEDALNSVSEIIRLLATGDFRGGIFGLQEDDPFIDFLFRAREYTIYLWETFKNDLLPALTELAGKIINEAIPAFVEFMTPIIQQVIPGIGLLVATIWDLALTVLPYLITYWNFLIENLNYILPVLGVVGAVIAAFTAPILLVVGAIVLLATAWANNWGGIQEKTQAVLDFIMPYIETAMAAIQQVITSVLTYIQAWWKLHGENVITIIAWMWENLKRNFRMALDAIWFVIQTVLAIIKAFWNNWGDEIILLTSTAWENIKVVIDAAMQQIGFIIDLFAAIIKGDWQGFVTALKNIWSTAWEATKTILSNAASALGTILQNQVVTPLSNKWTSFKENLKQLWSAAWDWIKSVLSSAASSLSGMVQNSIINPIISKWDGFKNSLQSTWENLWDSLVDIVEDSLNPFKNAIDELIGWVNDAIDALWEMVGLQDDAGDTGGPQSLSGSGGPSGKSFPFPPPPPPPAATTINSYNLTVNTTKSDVDLINEFQYAKTTIGA